MRWLLFHQREVYKKESWSLSSHLQVFNHMASLKIMPFGKFENFIKSKIEWLISLTQLKGDCGYSRFPFMEEYENLPVLGGKFK